MVAEGTPSRTVWIFSLMALAVMSNGWASRAARFEGITSNLERTLKPLAETLLQQSPQELGLERAKADAAAETLRQRLQSLGYLEAAVRAQPQLHEVLFEVDLGKQFKVDRIRWEILESRDLPFPPALWPESVVRVLLEQDVDQLKGQPLEVETFARLQLRVTDELRKEGYAFAEPEKVRLRADSVTEQVNVTLPLILGQRVRLGSATADGLERVRPEYVEQRVCWCPGELYSPSRLDNTRETLLRSGLFNSVQMRLGAPEGSQDPFPVLISVQERKPRTLSLGVTYATTEGAGVLLGWENRNIGGMGERLSADLIVAQIIQELTLSGRRPALGRPDLNWVSFAIARRKHVLSYLERSADLALLLEWEAGRQWLMSGGFKVEGLTVRDSPENGQNLIGTLPLFLSWSDRDDPAKPTRGTSLLIRAAPTGASGSPSSLFFPFRATASVWVPFGQASFEGRVTVGSILGASLESIPLPLRFFEGSVEGLRGYRYQTVSPLNGCGIPIGGRSLLLFNAELRAPITSTIELIPFADVGNVFASSWPDLNVRPLAALGLGVRYDSLLGPLRLDVALPLNRRPCLDKPFSIYFGVGRSF
jgi:translocation and assembly module TamA